MNVRDKKKLVALFYTVAAGSHAGAWSTHAGECVSVAALLQATLVRPFWRCCVRVRLTVGRKPHEIEAQIPTAGNPTPGRGGRTLGRARG